jgi:hypothetical protein
LKWLIRTATRCLRRTGDHSAWAGPDTLETSLRTHDVGKLADCFESLLDALDIPAAGNRLDQPTRDILNWLADEDSVGDLFRYSTVGPAKNARAARPESQNINFYDQVSKIHNAAIVLQSGVSSWLDAWEHDQSDYLSEMSTYGP